MVQLIENGKIHSEEMTQLLNKYLNVILEKNADCIVLGCTHYPYLIPQIKSIVGPSIHIIDSGEAVARQTKHILSQHNLLNPSTKVGENQILINADSSSLKSILGDRTNYKVNEVLF